MIPEIRTLADGEKISGPSVDYLRQRIAFVAETGKMIWKRHPEMPEWWNNRFAGTPAINTLDKNGYLVGAVDSIKVSAHRVLWAMVHGDWPIQIDHINHDKADNRLDNLRQVSQSENIRNRPLFKNNTSGACGVYWCKQTQKWRATIGVNGKAICLGRYACKETAISVRKDAQAEHDFHENHGAP